MFSLMAYEPGSTLKPLVMAAALDSGKVTSETHFSCTGRTPLTKERVISCPFAPRGGHGSVRPEDIIRYSCNVGAMQVGLALGNDTALEYLERFGFLRNTRVEFDERPGSVPDERVRDPRWSATCAFGQSVLVTPLQLATAYAALANGGKLMRPYVVAERVAGAKGPRVTLPEVVGQAVRPEVARAVVDMMTKVVQTDDGTGTAARMQGITVAGKTGTAEKFVNGRYSQSRYVVSFVGLVPAEAPEYVILVVVDEPAPGSAYGGMVAAPAFRDIAGSIAAAKGLEPTVARTSTGESTPAKHG
jgi:cell division protein FtsI/penicillin-binding protein 2